MTTAYIANNSVMLVAQMRQGRWDVSAQLEGKALECVAADPLRPERVYCGTRGEGLWRSDDAGASWKPVGEGIRYADITSVAVSPVERAGDDGVVYAGTEPTALFRSDDGGATWHELVGLAALPSAGSWSFPPRPWTHHARWITLDPLQAGRLWVCVEAGALVRSLDAGQTWEDRGPDSPYDTHTLRVHPLAPGRLYAAAGDGFMKPGAGYIESHDAGNTWERPGAGLQHHYLWGLAVDPAEPGIVVVSAAAGPQQAHSPMAAAATLYRKQAGQPWQEVRPEDERTGAAAYIVATNSAEPGVFYAASNRGLYRSPDAGLHWEILPMEWPGSAEARRPVGLEVVEL